MLIIFIVWCVQLETLQGKISAWMDETFTSEEDEATATDADAAGTDTTATDDATTTEPAPAQDAATTTEPAPADTTATTTDPATF